MSSHVRSGMKDGHMSHVQYIRTIINSTELKQSSMCNQSGSGLSQKFFGNFVCIRSLIWVPKGLLPVRGAKERIRHRQTSSALAVAIIARRGLNRTQRAGPG